MVTRKLLLRLFIPFFAFLPAGQAQFVEQGNKLVGGGAVGLAGQGQAVAVSADGNTAIVGGPTDDNEVGAAWVYARVNGIWNQQGPKLVGVGSVGRTWQGYSVALSNDGNTALVGGPLDNFGAGAVWIFTRANGLWSQQGPKLVGAGGMLPQQGTSVALSADGNTALVGASNFDNGGAIFLYTRANGQWSQQGPLLTAGDKVGFAALGSSGALSADGNTALVGGDLDNNGVGAAWVFVRSNGIWTQQGSKLTGRDAVGPGQQGIAVALSADGNTALVGGSSDNLAGAVWVYTRTNGQWSQQGNKLVTANGLGLGQSVALSADGNLAVAGLSGYYGGAVAFARQNGVWSQQGGIFGHGKVGYDGGPPPSGVITEQGRSVALSADGNTAILGAPFDNLGVGAALVFGRSTLHFSLSTPASRTSGVPFTFIVRPMDGTDSTTGYAGVLHFSSSDPMAILPPDSALGNFAAVLTTAGSQTITVTDARNPGISGTSNPILVAANSSVNVALGKTATQSSTYAYPAAGPGSAVDGGTDGNFFNGSVAATNFETNPWWQVDLGASSIVTSIVIWNRTDCCGLRLNDYWVFVSDLPFSATDTPVTLQVRPGTWGTHQTAAPNPSAAIAAGNIRGRYVRVQLSGSNYLSLAEVQVFSNPASGWNQSLGKQATQSSTLPGYPAAGASSAVDGNTDGNLFHNSVTATNLETEPWWQVDLGVTTLIDSIVIYNRTDCCLDRLGEYYVFGSDIPLAPTDTIARLVGRLGTYWSHQTAAPNPSAVLAPGGFAGRYVRVNVPGTNYLSLAEVQVSGIPNLAQGKAATQSSTLPGSLIGGAAAAVDGNTDGNFFDGSVTATNLESNPWWQVDLGASASIRQMRIWNRTDCCWSTLNDFWIFMSDTPFEPSDTPQTLQNRPGTRNFRVTNFGLPSGFNIGFSDGQGRYVRVQLTGAGNLSLAEVQVFGTVRETR